MQTRRSELALVLVNIIVDGAPHMLFCRHRKWGDLSLIGGHVEHGEEHDWQLAAIREVEEELVPFRFGVDFLIEPTGNQTIEWGPVPSKSKGNTPTIYAARYYLLKFTSNPASAITKLDVHEFALVHIGALGTELRFAGVSDTFDRFALAKNHDTSRLPLSWPTSVPACSLPASLEIISSTNNHARSGSKIAAGQNM